MDKKELRAHFRHLRSSLSEEERMQADTAIEQRVVSLPEFEAAHTVFAYLSFGAEVETRGIIAAAWNAGKTVALPRCVPGTRLMEWYRTDSLDGLETSSLGVEEPRANAACKIEPVDQGQSLVLVPGLTFDTQGYRLGYGGGFYDTFLADAPAHFVSVGLCREVQLSEQVQARDAHDLPVRMVVTDARVIS